MANTKRRLGGDINEEIKASEITVNDVFEEISEENKRLLNELMFGNKCLNVLIRFKTFIDFISHKFDTNLNPNECQKFESLLKEVENIISENNGYLESVQISDNQIVTKEESAPIERSDPRPVLKDNRLSNNNTKEDNYKTILKKQRIVHRINRRLYGSSNPNELFICQIPCCGKQLKTRKTLRRHIKTHSKTPTLHKCQIDGCVYKSSRLTSFRIHMKSHKRVISPKPNKKYKCEYESCGKVFPSEPKLDYHMKYIHLKLEKPFKCEYIGCHFRTAQKTVIKLHVNEVHEGVERRPYPCPLCRRRYATIKRLEEHKQRYHLKPENEVSINCPIEGCYALIASDSGLEIHLLQHKKKLEALIDHKEFVCVDLDCDFSTDSSTELETHHKQHWFEFKFHCPVDGCEERLRRSWDLTLHIKAVHPNYKERLFKCHICGHTSKSRPTAKNHQLIAHSDIKLPCDWPGCEFTTRFLRSLNRHQSVHSTERKFLCDWPECKKRFKLKTQLNEHLRIHNNDKRYACSWPGCTYRCTQSGNLSKHNRIHMK